MTRIITEISRGEYEEYYKSPGAYNIDRRHSVPDSWIKDKGWRACYCECKDGKYIRIDVFDDSISTLSFTRR